MLNFQKQRPHRALAPYVHYYGEIAMPTISSQPILDHVVPNLGKGIIFWCHTKSPAIHTRSDFFDQPLPPAFILPQGSVTNSWTHYGGLDSFAIIFRPGKMRKLFRQPWLEALNGVIPLIDAGEPALLELHERIQLTQNFQERCRLAEALLLDRLRAAAPQKDVVDFSLKLFHAGKSNSCKTVARQANYSTRHLRRLFTQEMGITPKSYQQLKRITFVLANLYQGEYANLTGLSYAAGYSDQAHFIRDFKKYLGVSPRQFLKNRKNSANGKLSSWAEEEI